MVLRGFRCPALAGWFSGILFTKNPITYPVFTSWISFYTLYVFVINLIYTALLLDFALNLRWGKLQTEIVRDTIINGFFASLIIALVLVKFHFIVKGKSVSVFLKTLEHYPVPVSSFPLQQRKFRRWCFILNWISFALCMVTAVIVSVSVSDDVSAKSWFFALMGRIPWMLSCLIFALLPSFLSPFVAFAFICLPLSNLLLIFEDFCLQVETHFKSDTAERVVEIFHTKYFGALNNSHYGRHGRNKIESRGRNNYIWRHRNLIEQFQKIKELFKTYDELAGPLILILIVNSTVCIIQAANDIILSDAEYRGAHPAAAWLSLVTNAIYLCLLNLGEWSKETMRSRKESLHHLLASSPETPIKSEFESMVQILDAWQWKMSAAGFFSVDRSLMGGIVSTMMSYVVILFQLHEGIKDNRVKSPQNPTRLN